MDSGTLRPVALAAELVAVPLPPTSRTNPDRRDLEIKNGHRATRVTIRSCRMAKRPSNWVRKVNALNQALAMPSRTRGMVLLPGLSPFSSAFGPHTDEPACLLAGLRLDLPFDRPADFGKLLAGVRVLLPLLPAFSASTPLLEGRVSGHCSGRLRSCLDLYDRYPERVGGFIPEPRFELAEYDREVLGPIATAMARSSGQSAVPPQALDWRAATVEADPAAISIHAIDAQENPAADMAVIEFALVILRALVGGRWVSSYLQRAWSTEDLMSIMRGTIQHGASAVISNKDYLFMFGLLKQEECEAARLLQHLFVELYGELSDNARERINLIIEQGDLATRIQRQLGPNPAEPRVLAVYGALAECRNGGAFR